MHILYTYIYIYICVLVFLKSEVSLTCTVVNRFKIILYEKN